MTQPTAIQPKAATAGAHSVSSGTNPLPRMVYYLLIATLVMFIGANTFGSTITVAINLEKWLPLAGLLVLTPAALAGRRLPEVPPVPLAWLVLFLVLALGETIIGVEEASVFQLVPICVTVATGYVVAAALVATDGRRVFFDLVGAIGRILVAASLLFYIPGINLGRAGGFSAWVDNPNTLASILAPGMVVFIAGCIERRPGWKWRHLLFLIVSLPVLWATNGRASFVWLGFAAAAFWLYRRGSWMAVAITMAVMIALIGWWEPITGTLLHYLQLDIDPRLTTQAGPLSGREEVWRIGADLFQERPLLGYGIGTSKGLLEANGWRLMRFQGSNFHSSYIMLLVETGLVGFFTFMAAMIATVARGISDAKRTRVLPRESWPLAALPFAMIAGALGHATFEAWLIAPGNVNAPLFWTCVWLIHFQAQIPIRTLRRRQSPAPARQPAAALRTQ